MTTARAVFEAVRAGDLAGLRACLDANPALARAREKGISLVLTALYHRQPELAAVVAAELKELDVFEAAALDATGRLAELLEIDPELARGRAADGFTPLHLAAYFGNPDAARQLLATGADPDAVADNPTGLRPLHGAAAARSTAVAAVLLEAGADPNARQLGGWTPLHAAARHGDRELAQALLVGGAAAEQASDDGKTARELALEAGHGELAILLERGW
jgi:ankyrin repeat protein